MNDFSLIVLSFRCYAIHKYIHRFWGAQYNVRYIPRDQEAVSSLQSAVGSPQSAVGSLLFAVEWPPFHGRKNLAFQARQIELPRLSSRGPLMISRQFSVGSRQSAIRIPQITDY